MSKQFEVKKIYKVIIKIPSSLDEYYNLKNIYDESIHKNKKRKCINCRKVNMSSLLFTVKNRNLISICPTPDCKSNMIISIMNSWMSLKRQDKNFFKLKNKKNKFHSRNTDNSVI
jgi:lysyl-tRNA synthetase class I